MGDAFTHNARDTRHFRLQNEFYTLLVDYLLYPFSSKIPGVRKAAEELYRQGYLVAPSAEPRGLQERLDALVVHRDAREWARLLSALCEFDLKMYEKAKAESPFTDDLLIFVRVEGAVVRSLPRDIGELKDLVEAAINDGAIAHEARERWVMLVCTRPVLRDSIEL